MSLKDGSGMNKVKKKLLEGVESWRRRKEERVAKKNAADKGGGSSVQTAKSCQVMARNFSFPCATKRVSWTRADLC